MRAVIVVGALVALLASGCVAPVPDDAVHATLPDFPGPTLYLWHEEEAQNVVFHGRLHNDHDRNILVNKGEFPNPWEFELRNATGDIVTFHNRPEFRDAAYEFVAPGEHFDFRFTWGRVIFDDAGNATDAPAGDYAFTLRIDINQERANQYVGTLQAQLPFQIASLAEPGPEATSSGAGTT